MFVDVRIASEAAMSSAQAVLVLPEQFIAPRTVLAWPCVLPLQLIAPGIVLLVQPLSVMSYQLRTDSMVTLTMNITVNRNRSSKSSISILA